MKKFFEKHDLFKISFIFVLVAVLLTWFVQIGYFQEGELVIETTNKLGFWNISNPAGVFDLGTYSLLGFYYFPTIFVFIFVVAGFYKFLGSTAAYQKMTTNLANKFVGKEKILLAATTLIFACLSGIVGDQMILLVLIPFAITILSKLKIDKVSGVAATFGGVLVGVIGSTYSAKISGQLVSALNLSYGFELVSAIILFAIAYLLLVTFIVLRNDKVKKNENADLLVDPFVYVPKKESKKSSKVSTVGISVVLFLTIVVAILATIAWTDAFNVTTFTNMTTSVKENAKLFGVPIFSYLLGNVGAFGEWDLLTISSVLLIATLLIKILYRISFDDVIDQYAKGFRKISKSVVVLLVIYVVLEFSVMFPVMPTIVDGIMNLGNNIFTMFISGALTSLFTVDFQYTVSLLGGLFKTFENVNLAGFALQGSYGVMSFIAPTSAILMLGLSMLDVKYSSWLKFIWKFVLALLVVTLIVLAVLAYA